MRRSSPKRENQQNKYIKSKLAAQDDDDLGLKVVVFPIKGRGLITKKALKKREFVLEYVGEIIDAETARSREIKYSRNNTKRSYMYYFKLKGRIHCIDGTYESRRLGRLLNHSRKHSNLLPRVIVVKQEHKIIFQAKRDIAEGEELLVDYGERDKEAIKDNPWLLL